MLPMKFESHLDTIQWSNKGFDTLSNQHASLLFGIWHDDNVAKNDLCQKVTVRSVTQKSSHSLTDKHKQKRRAGRSRFRIPNRPNGTHLTCPTATWMRVTTNRSCRSYNLFFLRTCRMWQVLVGQLSASRTKTKSNGESQVINSFGRTK